MTVTDAAAAFKTALVAACETACRPLADPAHQLGVYYGHPGIKLPDDIVSVMRVTAQQEPGPIGTNRARDLTLTADVTVSIYRAGGADQEAVAAAQAYALLTAVEEHCRVTDTTLGGAVWWCFCTSHESEGATNPDLLAKGRVIEITATFTARARITS